MSVVRFETTVDAENNLIRIPEEYLDTIHPGIRVTVSLSTFNNTPASAAGVSSEAFNAWEAFKKYKGIVQYDIDEKAELAMARDEKYSNSN